MTSRAAGFNESIAFLSSTLFNLSRGKFTDNHIGKQVGARQNRAPERAGCHPGLCGGGDLRSRDKGNQSGGQKQST